ncbi:winged helix-turn-helix domain-containing protein [Methanocella sp. MCL-LM]|uniref:winged helix-turn-helix domain-containing protein n=1 Tax=Methanocella sp. MCL-LM TaxID=3412035 RepID=UPI003C78D1FF
MERLTITRQQARSFMLAHQGLWPPGGLEGKAGVAEYIRRVNCIQFDPLNIAGPNHELVLQARVKDFRSSMLQELLYQDRTLIDGWDKNMCIYPVEDWPYFRRTRERAKKKLGGQSHPISPYLDPVRREIEEKGPLTSADLAFDDKIDWPWGPTRVSRAALESMYFWGELVVHHKVGTRRVYDFACRHLPDALLNAPDRNRTDKQYYDWYVHRRIGSIGLLWNRAGDAWLGISGIKSKDRNDAIERLLRQEMIVQIGVEDISHPFYARSEDLACLEKVLRQRRSPQARASVLAPLDNLIWDRKLVKELFGFDYLWEVYKPVAERRYGYYVLPVLYGERFVARFEPGRGEDGALLIKNWWWEPEIEQTEELRSGLLACFCQFSDYLGAGRVTADKKVSRREKLGWLAV